MNHPNLHTTLKVALAVMSVRLLLYYSHLESEWAEPSYLFINLGALPALSVYAIWPRASYTGFLEDAKASMKLLGLYSLLMTVFFFVYYQFVDVEFFKSKQEALIYNAIQSNEEGIDPEDAADKVRSFFSLRNGTAIVLAGYVALSAFYSIFFSALKRLVPGLGVRKL
jgi:hypothetical protein